MLKRLQQLIPVLLASGFLILAQEQTKKPPEKLTFKTKQGDVTFNHAAHIKAAKNECKTCHPALWPQSATAPLNFKAAMHKTAETNHTSCGFCHHPGGASFETKANCARCHHRDAK
jgi:c(7)-type cytochrome triheme protein